jgi:hypothetical protein
MDFSKHTGGGDQLITVNTLGGPFQQINNGIIEEGGGFTVEAAFRPDVIDSSFQAIIAKKGLPNYPDGPNPAIPTLAMKIRGDGGKLQFEQVDEAGGAPQVQSISPLVAGQWYAAAAVNDGTTLSLYLRGQSDSGYVFQASTPVDGALYQGGEANDWSKPWQVGYGLYGGMGDGTPFDWFDGIIDEVRISNTALDPSDFLFAPPDTGGDFNGDLFVDAADYVVWRKTMSTDEVAYAAWRETFGTSTQGAGGSSAVPEPTSLLIASIALLATALVRRRG